jgi:hypothetical protein
MTKRSTIASAVALATVLAALLVRATTLHSVNYAPLIYRVVSNVNDLDGVEGVAPPGKVVELWTRQRNFKEGNDGTDPFGWCSWKHDGVPIRLGVTVADAHGVWRFANLRAAGNTVMIFPAAPAGDRCLGGLYTELLPRTCDSPGFNCSTFATPTLHWLNVRKLTPLIASTAGSISGAEQASAAVADGPNDGPEPSDVVDVDQNGVDTTAPGFTVGQRITWRCGAGGNLACPASRCTTRPPRSRPTPSFLPPRHPAGAPRGGSFIAAAAIPRGQPIGFAVNVNVKFRGRLDVNLGCDRRSFFDFSVPPRG